MSDNLAVEMSRIGIERPSLVIGDAVKNAVNGGRDKFTDTNIIAHCRALFGEDRNRHSRPANIVQH